mgnify:CR=1 FL=1
MVEPTHPTLTREATVVRLAPFLPALATLLEETERLLSETHPSAGSLRTSLLQLSNSLGHAESKAKSTLYAAEHETADAAFAEAEPE